MRFLVVVISLVLISRVLPDVSVVRAQARVKTPEQQAKKPEVSKPVEDGSRNEAAPVVEAWEPKTASVDTLIYLSGYRLYPSGDTNKTKAFFIQNGVEFPAGAGGGSWITNNQHNFPQTLNVIVPAELAQGQAQIVVEYNGRRSNPATITITEWKLPVIERLNPARGAPGTLVRIEGEGFHVHDEIAISDVNGKPVRANAANGPLFGIPADTPEGILTVRVGSRDFGKGQFTEPVTFTVTNEPLAVELLTDVTKSVAPGQWVDLQISNSEPLKRSERTEIAFKQAGRTIIVAAPKPFRPHVRVPSELSAGEVQLQLRTWRDGRPSEWSEQASFELEDKRVGPWIDSIRLTNGTWAALSPGPDRKTSFSVSPGDEVVLNGLWPVADASKLKVSLARAGEVITMTATEFDEKATWFADIKVRLPESMEVGDWRMTVGSDADGTQVEVPIVIRVAKR